jgi:HD-GYP domain-containing protein (c-di-GMP phosphodiesterase class II)
MCSNRAYRKALPHQIAVEELARCAGRQFDPNLIRVFLDNVDGLRERWKREGHWVPE